MQRTKNCYYIYPKYLGTLTPFNISVLKSEQSDQLLMCLKIVGEMANFADPKHIP